MKEMFMKAYNGVTMHGRITSPHLLELENDVSIPLGSRVSVLIGLEKKKRVKDRFRAAVGSWKNIGEDLITTLYADRAISRRRDVRL